MIAVELDDRAAIDNLPRWPVRGRPMPSYGQAVRMLNQATPAGSWRVLGLSFCCLRPVTISEWVRDRRTKSMAPVFVCQQCCRVGFREAFDVPNPALERTLRVRAWR